jgi:glucose-1-phosphate adenylyltransferase
LTKVFESGVTHGQELSRMVRDMAIAPKVLVMVLAGGEGKRLMPLTLDRAKPAVPFGGTYRLVDFVLSNFANSNYLKMVVLTQYKSHSLDRHISATWQFSNLLGNYVTPVPAQMRRGPRWFVGSADAIFQNFNLISDEMPDIVAVFGADHIYRMDPRQMVHAHRDMGGGVTVAAIPVPLAEAPEFGIMEVKGDKIVDFHEKPSNPPLMPGRDDMALASMGNYVFDTDVLLEAITEDAADENSAHDLGGNIIPNLTKQGRANWYDFNTNNIPGMTEKGRGYWRDVGSLDAYYHANMDLISPDPVFDLYNQEWPVYTSQSPLPPAKLVQGSSWAPGTASASLLCQGTIVSGGHVERSIVSPGVFVDDGAVVHDSIIMHGAKIGPRAIIRRAIIDKNVTVPAGAQIGIDRAHDLARGFTISAEGVVVVPKGAPIAN